MKRCSKCKKIKLEKDFYKDKYRPDKLCCACKDCNKTSKEKRNIYYLKNKEQIIEKQKKYCKENKKKIREYNKEYQKNYYIINKNSSKRLYKCYKADAKRKNIEFKLIFDDFNNFSNENCKYCGLKLDRIRIDRINSSIGYRIENCVPCCFICNSAKNTMSLSEWKDYLYQIHKFYKHGEIRYIIKTYEKNCSSQFLNYKANAKRKGIDFNLNYYEFLSFLNIRCEYCGTIIKNFISLDRIDNSIGYNIENCVSCCKTCNYGKKNMELQDWLNWIEIIKNKD